MSKFSNYFILFVCFLLATFSTVNSISCYQCSGTDSDNPFECTEWLGNDIDLKPTDCGAIHNAQFCIKHVGRFEGTAILCYQCNSTSTMECGDGLMKLDGGVINPTSCEHVYNAKFCIKQIGFTL
ncbi:uncharacterized protein LOC113231765 isoform X2 [Hyposmocoma kahamanoa]|uniref:uncharacterized protein LOC113231765 isoform X2 n=1 Tax=Hyposmocoma kahamanoa TaxID=1477025 RepID=UPI000E6D73F9|nr:uncharacterized protein LOC113231765 isoform X2 [Hyposmocoma kahamanoa]